MAAGRMVVYLAGLALVLVALWLLLTQTPLAGLLPVTLIAVALLLVFGLGVMRAAHVAGPRVVEREVVDRPYVRREVVAPPEDAGPVRRHRRRWR